MRDLLATMTATRWWRSSPDTRAAMTGGRRAPAADGRDRGPGQGRALKRAREPPAHSLREGRCPLAHASADGQHAGPRGAVRSVPHGATHSVPRGAARSVLFFFFFFLIKTGFYSLLIQNASVEQLGTARKATISQNSTTIIADAATKDEIQARIAQLKKELAERDKVYDSEKLAERIAKLSGSVAVVKIGAATKTELEDRELRIEDAKNATFAAIGEGIVPGGGATLVHLSTSVPSIKDKLKGPD